MKEKMKQEKQNKQDKEQKKQGIKEILAKNPGFKGFLIKTIIFIVLFIGVQLLTIPFQKINLPKEYGLSYLLHPELGNVIIFSVISFFLLSRNKLLKLKKQKANIKENLLFGVLFVFLLSIYFYFKYFLSTNIEIALKYVVPFLILQYLMLLLATILLFISVFGLKLSKTIIKDFRKEILTVLIITFITYIIIELLKNTWIYLSFIVTYAVYFLLKLSGLNPVMKLNTGDKGPLLGADNFKANIGKPCSGIDSLTLFALLFLFILFLDWKKLNKKRMLILLIPGAIGMFLVNIIRIYLLMLVGIRYSTEFAIGLFHSNAGWIFFIIYASLFWWKMYGWVKRKS